MRKIKIITFFIAISFRIWSQQYIIVGDTISSYITYNNIKDTVVPFIAKSSFSVDLDIDYDGINDVRFYRAHNSSPAFSQINQEIHSLISIQFVRTLASITNCDTLVLGDTIRNNLNWNNNYNYGNFNYSFSGPPPPWGPGNSHSGVCSKNNTYIGFRKIYTNDTLYGWFLLDFQGTYKIKSYAISKKIYVTGFNETHKNEYLNIYPTPASDVIYLQSTQENFINEPVLYDLKGAKVNTETNYVNSHTYKIDVSNLPNGIYFVFVQTNLGYLKKKVIVSK